MSSRLVAALFLLVACDPGRDFHGKVVDRQGKPITDATAAVVCDGSVQDGPEPVDAGGEFRLTGIGWLPNDCVVRIAAPARASRDFPLGKHCTKRRGSGACLEASIEAVLAEPALTPR